MERRGLITLSLRRPPTLIFLLAFILTLPLSFSAKSARAAAYVVLESEFRPAHQDSPECAVAGQEKTATSVLDFSPGLKIVRQNDGMYCVLMKWRPAEPWQRLFISGRFWQMFVSDIISEERAPILILFVGDLFETITVGMVEGKFVVTGQCCQMPPDIYGALGAPAIGR